ncbi:nitric oxide reductase activation protein NorD [Varunaivibrio sulfuroxidans]|uniref:von Willebrand factor type A domain-containing protein n=1 Tax=Varunaivibrio sulfuroxidans TaxID=1773489 RepID=A0A4R3JDY5_9PROT|nr:VWA domain-containing protein [Varunaivibrio sulfuroxidans]TCS64279.1 von Willebrand factor type A domain-containing protein [Varunaivibrio sulfuroxidans]WES31283.1 VWA domain-containing protein [Varunaivibrio sulfuroxidans]
MTLSAGELEELRRELSCGFEQLDGVFPECMENAVVRLSPAGVKTYLEGASLICMIGRGFEPVLTYLEKMPELAERLGEETLSLVSQSVWKMSRTPNGQAIPPFLQCLPEAARRLGTAERLGTFIDIVFDIMARTTRSIHGFHATIPSPGLVDFLDHTPYLLSQLSLDGVQNWVAYGLRYYLDHPDRQRDYFSLQSADSRAVLQRERHGTLYGDVERALGLYLRALWRRDDFLIPYSTGFDELRKPTPYFDHLGIRLPDVYDDLGEIAGIDRYRALLAHIAAHRRWTRAIVADNFSPFQRLAIETFEDLRVETLAIRLYPGLGNLWRALHPKPIEGDCDPDAMSCIRHRLAMFSYAVLDPDHPYGDPNILSFVERFHAEMEHGESSTKAMADLAVTFITKTRGAADLSANIYFKDTEIDYRDDNRHMWTFIEMGDEEEMFDQPDKTQVEDEEQQNALPPRYYPEWDYHTQSYRPDWASLYESLHPSADPARIDDLLVKHAALAKQLKKLMDLLKPQRYVRIRFQEDGSELDLDVALRSLLDFKSGCTPDPRITMSHRHDGRDIAVLLLLDLSESLDHVPPGGSQSILELSQEAVALLAWAIDGLGDTFAIAGFSSNTRHEVRYQHIKGYGEKWDDTVKARLAAMAAGYSTRMGAALRHGGHYLSARKADKKLMLVLTDGEPSDIDVKEDRLLIEDTRKAVQELDRDGIYTYCINLDPDADNYVRDIFANRYTVIDRVERLPERLPQLFMALTK